MVGIESYCTALPALLMCQPVRTARASRGTQTKDTFSLFGFSAALEEAQNRCAG